MSRVADAVLAPLRWFESLSSSVQDRLVGLTLALPSGIVLGVARWLQPDPTGVGTHRQLGLGGCSLLSGTGVPCPMCGMTTTFSHLAHLELLQGVVNQPFGLVLFLCTLGSFALGLSELLLPRQRWRRVLDLVERFEGWIAGGLMLGLILGWAYKIVVMSDTVAEFLSKAR